MRHQKKEDIILQMQIHRMVNEEVERRMRKKTELLSNVSGVIISSHRADMLLIVTILKDKYGASDDFIRDLMDDVDELLGQYQTGQVELKQMEGHFKLITGMTPDEYEQKFRETIVGGKDGNNGETD